MKAFVYMEIPLYTSLHRNTPSCSTLTLTRRLRRIKPWNQHTSLGIYLVRRNTRWRRRLIHVRVGRRHESLTNSRTGTLIGEENNWQCCRFFLRLLGALHCSQTKRAYRNYPYVCREARATSRLSHRTFYECGRTLDYWRNCLDIKRALTGRHGSDAKLMGLKYGRMAGEGGQRTPSARQTNTRQCINTFQSDIYNTAGTLSVQLQVTPEYRRTVVAISICYVFSIWTLYIPAVSINEYLNSGLHLSSVIGKKCVWIWPV